MQKRCASSSLFLVNSIEISFTQKTLYAMSRLSHSLPSHSAPGPINVRYAPKATELLRRGE
jgi:hypothetical protein